MKQNTPLQRKTPLKRGDYQLTRSPLSRGITRLRRNRLATPGLWSEKTADDRFSVHIRTRDGKCLRCNGEYRLTCSHFHGRTLSLTRFDPENCDTFCLWCHDILETKKNLGQEYYQFKLLQLGQEKFDALKVRADTIFSRSDAIKNCMEFLGEKV